MEDRMPLFAIPSDQAIQTRKNNPVADWGDRGSANRVEPIALPEFEAPFKIEPGESIFTIGSCFARNVEVELMRRGFHVPVRDLFKREEFQDLDINIINNYGTPSIYNEIAWAFGEQPFNPEDHIVEVSPGKFVDLHQPPTMRPGTREAVVKKREAIIDATRSAKDCRVVIMTLGLTEVWFDTKTGYYLNLIPRPSLAKAEPNRFQLHVLSYEETFDYLNRAILLLKKHGRPDLRVVLTVSPVPLEMTHRQIDVLLANTYSKAALRVAAESVIAAHPFVAYYPSYESITISDRRRAFRDDMRHATNELVAINVGRMVAAYCGGSYDRERIASEIEAGGADAAVAQATLAAASSFAAEFFADHGRWSDESLDFGLIHARHLVGAKAYSEAIPILRRYWAERPDNLEPPALLAEALLKDGQKDEAAALLQELQAAAPRRSHNFWDALMNVAMELQDTELLLTILARYAMTSPPHAPGAFFRAARYFRENKDEVRAIRLFRESWEQRQLAQAGLELAELLILTREQEEASAVLRQIKPENPRQQTTLDRLNHLASLHEV
jgi:thioredoxin-like negative regulator of GroEL